MKFSCKRKKPFVAKCVVTVNTCSSSEPKTIRKCFENEWFARMYAACISIDDPFVINTRCYWRLPGHRKQVFH